MLEWKEIIYWGRNINESIFTNAISTICDSDGNEIRKFQVLII